MEFAFDMSIVEFDSFETAFPVPAGEEDAAKRRFMTLFVESERHMQVGGTSYVCRARSTTGEVFAVKRLLAGAGIPKGAVLSEEDTKRITEGHEAAFYEEYRNQMLVSRMRGFPRLYGYGAIDGEPAIVMEWVEGVSLRAYARSFEERGEQLGAATIADIGTSVLEVLENLSRLDATLAHRDISPANIMIRTDAATLDEQRRSGIFDICLIDFGSAAAEVARGDLSFTMQAHVWRNGTPAYAPPEMLTQDIPRVDELRKSQSIDVFALCSVLYELYDGGIPWDVGAHPEVSPYRYKAENAPRPLKARSHRDEPLVDVLMAGLAVEQGERPTVRELLVRLAEFRASCGESPDEGLRSALLEKRRVSAPVGLYTPDSTHLSVAGADEGGKRAGEAVGPFVAGKRGISRRSFVIGGAAIVAAAVIGGTLASRGGSLGGYVINGSDVAREIWNGAAAFPARAIESNEWQLISGLIVSHEGVSAADVAAVAFDTGMREPGTFGHGLIRAFDTASGGYGFKTLVEDGGGVRTQWALDCTFAQARDFAMAAGDADGGEIDPHNLRAAVRDPGSGLWGFIDGTGKTAPKAAYADAGDFSNGYAAVRAADGEKLWGLVDGNGSQVLKPAFRGLGRVSEEGLVAAAPETRMAWCFVGTDGKQALDGTWRKARRFTEGLAGVLVDADKGLWGFIDVMGSMAIEPRFSDVLPFSGGVAPARDPKTHMWGLIDKTGAWKAMPTFLRLGENVNGLFPAHGSPAYSYDYGDDAWQAYEDDFGNTDTECGYGFIDRTGTWIIRPTYADTLIRAAAC